MALRVIQNIEHFNVGEYHRIATIMSNFETVEIEVYRDLDKRESYKNGTFDTRFEKIDTYLLPLYTLQSKIKFAPIPNDVKTLYDGFLKMAYIALKEEMIMYSDPNYFEDC